MITGIWKLIRRKKIKEKLLLDSFCEETELFLFGNYYYGNNNWLHASKCETPGSFFIMQVFLLCMEGPLCIHFCSEDFAYLFEWSDMSENIFHSFWHNSAIR